MSFPEKVAGVTPEPQQKDPVWFSGRQQSLNSGMPQLSQSSHNTINQSVFACKETQTHRILISAWIGATASNKKRRGEKLLRNKTATSEGLQQEEDSYWICFILLVGILSDSFILQCLVGVSLPSSATFSPSFQYFHPLYFSLIPTGVASVPRQQAEFETAKELLQFHPIHRAVLPVISQERFILNDCERAH